MKKIFSFVAILALVCGMASCQNNKETEPEVKGGEFDVKVTAVTENSVTFDIVPSDKEATYDFVLMPTSQKADFYLPDAQNESYTHAKEGSKLFVGELRGMFVKGLQSNTKYTIAVYYVDTIFSKISEEATFVDFITEEAQAANTVEFNDQQAKIIDYTTIGYHDGNEVHHFWTVEAVYKNYELKLHSGSTMDIAGTYDAVQLAQSTMNYGDESHAIKAGEITVTGEKPDFVISGYVLDDANVRFNLNIKVTDYEEGGSSAGPGGDDPIGGEGEEGAGGVE